MLKEKNKPLYKYCYDGPIYRFEHLYLDEWVDETTATSESEALRNLTYKFKIKHRFTKDSKFTLLPGYLTKGEEVSRKETVKYIPTKKCPNCGTRLTDGGYCPVCDDGDEEALETLDEEVDCLDVTTPYMLKNDGLLLKCGSIHPYIKMSNDSSNETNLKTLESHPEFLDWFEKADPELHDLITEFKESTDVEEKYELMTLLNNITNQEFCRVRTSNYKVPYGGNNGEIYFRISSDGFNWFDLIWNVVNKFSNQIKTVTVLNDRQSKGGGEFDYYYDHIPVDEFLTLRGNPIVENKTNCIYNKSEEKARKKKKLTEEETEKDKEFDEKFGKYVGKPMSSKEFSDYMDEIIKFYD